MCPGRRSEWAAPFSIIYMTKNIDYIVIPELPEEQREPLRKWLIGQTRPTVFAEGENAHNCCYKWDYDNWYESWKKGETARITD